MGLASALSTALTGLNAAETTIDVVGNNVANSNTVGFKASSAVFATQFLQTQSLGSTPSDSRGGTNPRQIGLGTKIAEITPDFTQGTVQVSSNPLDLAIQGDGFFIVQGSQGETLYTRNGQFKTNADNEITTITGQRVLGFGIDDQFNVQQTGLVPITIPLGASAVAQATKNVYLEGTLTPTGVIATTPAVIESSVLSDGNFELPESLAAGDVTAIPAPAAGTSSITVGAAGALTAGTYQYRYTMVDGDGNETPASTPFALANPGGDQLVVDNLPALTGDYTSYNLYRTAADGSDFHRVANVAPGDIPYTDNATDASIAGNASLPETLAPGNYSYYYTLLDTATGLESRPSELIGPLSVGVSGREIRLDNLQQPTSADFNAVRIYRTTGNDDSTFYQIADLTGGETSFNDGIADADIVGNQTLNLDGPRIAASTLLVNLVRREGSNYDNVYVDTGVISFTPKKGGRTLDTKEFTITDTSTVQDLVNFMEDAMGVQEVDEQGNALPGGSGGSITNDSRLRFVSNLGKDSALDIGLSSFQLTTDAGTAETVSLPFATTQVANGESAVTDFVVYDTLGIPLNVRLTTVLESTTSASTTYRWYADSSDNDPLTGASIRVGTGTVTFDGQGNVSNVSEGTVSIDRRNVSSASPLEFELDFSQLSGLASEHSSIAASRQDGSGAGTLTSFIITEGGAINGVFSNGITRELGQLQLARFANNNGLEQVGQNMYAAGVNSGLPVLGAPGENGIGTVSAGATELSNTDIGQNLIDLILASTQYRGGTRVITAVQQLLDELMALRR
jgi:flagellar hook protein FlgE